MDISNKMKDKSIDAFWLSSIVKKKIKGHIYLFLKNTYIRTSDTLK